MSLDSNHSAALGAAHPPLGGIPPGAASRARHHDDLALSFQTLVDLAGDAAERIAALAVVARLSLERPDASQRLDLVTSVLRVIEQAADTFAELVLEESAHLERQRRAVVPAASRKGGAL